MFQPVRALPWRPLRAATLDDWAAPHDLGPVQKLATEMTALALTDAGLREAAGHSRTGMIIASTAPGLGDLVSSQLGFAASGPYPPAALTSSLHAVTAAPGGTLASRTVPRMRPAEPLAPATGAYGGTGTAGSTRTAGSTQTAGGTGARSAASPAG
jgi:hypothetical protein